MVTRAALHPVVRAALEEAGWDSSYFFDPSAWSQTLAVHGYTVTAPAIQVMQEVGWRPPRWVGR